LAVNNRVFSALATSLLVVSFYLELVVGFNRLYVMWQLSRNKLHAKFDVQLAPWLVWLGAGLALGLLGLPLLPGVRFVFERADYSIIFGYEEASELGRIVAKGFNLFLILLTTSLVVIYIAVGVVAKKAVINILYVTVVRKTLFPLSTVQFKIFP